MISRVPPRFCSRIFRNVFSLRNCSCAACNLRMSRPLDTASEALEANGQNSRSAEFSMLGAMRLSAWITPRISSPRTAARQPCFGSTLRRSTRLPYVARRIRRKHRGTLCNDLLEDATRNGIGPTGGSAPPRLRPVPA